MGKDRSRTIWAITKINVSSSRLILARKGSMRSDSGVVNITSKIIAAVLSLLLLLFSLVGPMGVITRVYAGTTDLIEAETTTRSEASYTYHAPVLAPQDCTLTPPDPFCTPSPTDTTLSPTPTTPSPTPTTPTPTPTRKPRPTPTHTPTPTPATAPGQTPTPGITSTPTSTATPQVTT